MKDLFFVCRLYPLCDLFEERKKLFHGNRASRNALRQCLSLHELHHEERRAVGFLEPEKYR